MPRRRDADTGVYKQAYPDEDILDLLEGTRLSTSEVATELDYHRTTAHDRLTTLEEEGEVESKTVGNTLIWELPE
ncbi:helix-turn-helix domain-containing protein [Halolamina salifodinae]|uniref:helix-turn-helix domain-containing protein n=1 Tax=Halolamina salifodinae TaxID=1202767 RepID=UPI001AEAF72C